MKCPQCNARLIGNSRYCSVCGYDLSTLPGAAPVSRQNAPSPANMPDPGRRAEWPPEQPTVPASWPEQAAGAQDPYATQMAQSATPVQSTMPAQDPYAPPQAWGASDGQPFQGGRGPQNYPGSLEMSLGTLRSEGTVRKRRRRRRGGCFLYTLLSLALIILVLVGAWFVAIRPYLHTMAQTQVDHVLSRAVQQINPSLLPPGAATVPLTQTTMNNLIVLNSAPSNPVQNMRAQISPGGIRFDFTAYGFACTVTMVPVAQNGLLQMTNVSVQGVLGLVMSPDELTATLNSHLRNAGARLQRTITGVVLKDQEMDVSLS